MLKTNYHDLIDYFVANPYTSHLIKSLAHVWFKINYDGGIVELPEYNLKMYLDRNDRVISKSIFFNHSWETCETKLFVETIKQGDTVLDIGANIGWYTLIAARKAKHVYAFEPEPFTFNFFTKNIQLNKFTNITAFNKAVSDKRGTNPLYFTLYDKSKATYQLSPVPNVKSVTVETTTLDIALRGKQVDVIVIDIEGYEAKAFKGMTKIFKNSPNLKIFSEYDQVFLANAGSSAQEYVHILKTQGFEPENILENGQLEPITYEKLLQIPSANLLLTRNIEKIHNK